jgi:bacteriorhodopsin
MMLDRLSVFTITTLAAVNAALAQATPPATSGSPAAPATTDGGAPWLWIIIGLAIIAGLVWYFMRGRSRATTTGSSTTPGTAAGGAKVYDSDKRK